MSEVDNMMNVLENQAELEALEIPAMKLRRLAEAAVGTNALVPQHEGNTPMTHNELIREVRLTIDYVLGHNHLVQLTGAQLDEVAASAVNIVMREVAGLTSARSIT